MNPIPSNPPPQPTPLSAERVRAFTINKQGGPLFQKGLLANNPSIIKLLE